MCIGESAAGCEVKQVNTAPCACTANDRTPEGTGSFYTGNFFDIKRRHGHHPPFSHDSGVYVVLATGSKIEQINSAPRARTADCRAPKGTGGFNFGYFMNIKHGSFSSFLRICYDEHFALSVLSITDNDRMLYKPVDYICDLYSTLQILLLPLWYESLSAF